MAPVMGGEDFSYMLEARPGAFIFVGNGDSPGLHHPRYNFNDDVIPYGTSYWVRLVETAMAAEGGLDSFVVALHEANISRIDEPPPLPVGLQIATQRYWSLPYV